MFKKQLVFDAAYFALTVALVSYTFSPVRPDADLFVADFPFFAGGVALCFLAGAALSVISPSLGVVTLGRWIFNRPKRGRFALTFLHLGLVGLLLVYVSLLATSASLTELLDADGLKGAWRLWSGLLHPNLALLPRAIAEATQTILIAFLATVLAIPPAFVASFFAAKNIMVGPRARVVYAILRLVLNVTRSIEPLIWALIFTVWVGVGPFAGMLALMVHAVASLTKYYSEIVEDVNEGPIDAVRSTGAHPVQVALFGVLPQVVLPFTAMTIYRWDTNVRMATVIGLVGGGGIGTLLLQYQGQAMWPEVGTIVAVIAVIVWLMDYASAQIRHALK